MVKDLVGKWIIVVLVFCSPVYAGFDFDKKSYAINVRAMNAADALNELAYQTGAVLLFPYEEAKAQQANAVSGQYTLKQAITLLLHNSGLVSSLTKDGAIRISVSGSRRQKKSEGKEMNTKKNILAGTIAFFVGAQGVVAQEENAGELDWLLEEVVVTATKRETSLQDTAMSISVMGAEEIERRGLVNMRDYLTSVPGVSMTDKGQARIK